ncbi:hypothetical protein P4O66_000819 [Electrophorus voltai]|uniref:RING-type domain-containing protein n=1 Tax=Electrophorus voltai TaxID=2609070 RepID=A0AAD8ZHA6_9TELE|nr:hypothetical protein P4O66_000819 [Electrophorus voltai]
MDESSLLDLLECSVCLERLDTTAKVLPCQHTFCRRCLENIVSSRHELRCPECRILVDCGVDDLPANILLVRLLDGIKQRPRNGGRASLAGMPLGCAAGVAASPPGTAARDSPNATRSSPVKVRWRKSPGSLGELRLRSADSCPSATACEVAGDLSWSCDTDPSSAWSALLPSLWAVGMAELVAGPAAGEVDCLSAFSSAEARCGCGVGPAAHPPAPIPPAEMHSLPGSLSTCVMTREVAWQQLQALRLVRGTYPENPVSSLQLLLLRRSSNSRHLLRLKCALGESQKHQELAL